MLLVAAILTFGCQFAVTGFVASAATSKLSASDNHCDSRFIASLESSDSKDFLQIRKLLRRRGGSPPPPPPPPLAVDAMSIGFAVVSVLMMAGLLACEMGVLPPVSIASRHVWLIFPLSQAYLHMAAYGVGPLTGASPRMAMRWAFSSTESRRSRSFTRVATGSVWSQNGSALLLCPGRHAWPLGVVAVVATRRLSLGVVTVVVRMIKSIRGSDATSCSCDQLIEK